MQITDILSQYHRNIASGTEIADGTKGIQQVASTLQELAVGNVFEGSVNQLENGVATLGLPDGKTIQAKLDSGVSVRVGESMFFQVRSNNGAQIAIRPFSNNSMTNPTLLNALKAASLPVNAKNLTMVHHMMEQSMPIDKQSLLQMAKLVAGSRGMDVTSIVQMAKLGIPVTEEMAVQFENYKSDQYAILDQLEHMMELLPEQLSGGELSQKGLLDFNRQMLQIFLGNPEAAADNPDVQHTNGEMMQVEDGMLVSPGEANLLTQEKDAAKDVILQMKAQGEPVLEQEAARSVQTDAPDHTVGDGAAKAGSETAAKTLEQISKTQPDLLKNLLSGSEGKALVRHLSQIPELAKNPLLFLNEKLNDAVTSKEFLGLLEQALATKNPFSRQALGSLTASKAYRAIVRNALEQDWLLRPRDLETEHKVHELYERLDRQLSQMEKVLKNFGQGSSNLSDTAANVRQNIQFMNQLNQAYAYVQIPLKLAGQNAHSDLYVYTDKRKKQGQDEELTAFLHLDLEHLGSTDVSVKMRQKKVATDFYMNDDLSYRLVLEHLDELQERLEEKGFQVKFHVSRQEEKANFVEQLLQQSASPARGMVHRYSFDVRA